MRRLFLAFFLVVVSACGSHEASEEHAVLIQVNEVPPEIKIPPAVWDKLGGHEESSSEEGGLLFMPVQVVLRELTPGVLVEPLLRIAFPRGGGEVDLSAFTTGRPGSFFVRFEWPERQKGDGISIWYDSKARRRNLDDGSWGVGCGKAVDVTEAFLSKLPAEGFKVNTTRHRHVTVLAGHFLFSMKRKSETLVAQVTFKDSKKPILFCEEL